MIRKGGVKMYERFNQLLMQYKVTPYKVSKETGVAQSTLSDWKTGRSTPKIDKLEVLADYFNVPVTFFLKSNKKRKAIKKL
jgi:transcriptional regulator with XRE-family HTH domain